jgi:glycosyltransferase involved in cell wall biosynthesis
VAHGLPVTLLDFSPMPGRYLAFLGRMAPEKRPDRAIRIACQAGLPLRMAAKVDAVDNAYFDEIVRPLLGEAGAEYIGEIDEGQKSAFLGNAAALLFPIDWPEPFGLVVIEAMACGTPVIAWDHGSVPELIEDGVTGFIVRSEEEAVAAVARIDELDREVIRSTFERRFSATAMARNYLKLYGALIRRAGRPSRARATDAHLRLGPMDSELSSPEP